MIEIQIGSTLNFWITDTDEIEEILTVMNLIVRSATKYGYSAEKSWVGCGMHERDTGYEDFHADYPTYREMEQKLCGDFSSAMKKLDGLWFDTLNFAEMHIELNKPNKAGTLYFYRGVVTLDCADENGIYSVCSLTPTISEPISAV